MIQISEFQYVAALFIVMLLSFTYGFILGYIDGKF